MYAGAGPVASGLRVRFTGPIGGVDDATLAYPRPRAAVVAVLDAGSGLSVRLAGPGDDGSGPQIAESVLACLVLDGSGAGAPS